MFQEAEAVDDVGLAFKDELDQCGILRRVICEICVERLPDHCAQRCPDGSPFFLILVMTEPHQFIKGSRRFSRKDCRPHSAILEQQSDKCKVESAKCKIRGAWVTLALLLQGPTGGGGQGWLARHSS